MTSWHKHALLIIKSPRSGMNLCFAIVKTFASHVKSSCAKPYIFGTRNRKGLGKFTGGHFCDLDPWSRLRLWLTKINILRDKVRSTHPTKRGSFIPLVMLITTWLDFLGKFSFKHFGCAFQSQALLWPYLRNGWFNWCETIRKCIGWILGMLCDLDLGLHSKPWSWIFQGKLSKYSQEFLVWLMWNETGSELIRYWAECITFPLTTPMNLTLKFQGQSLK